MERKEKLNKRILKILNKHQIFDKKETEYNNTIYSRDLSPVEREKRDWVRKINRLIDKGADINPVLFDYVKQFERNQVDGMLYANISGTYLWHLNLGAYQIEQIKCLISKCGAKATSDLLIFAITTNNFSLFKFFAESLPVIADLEFTVAARNHNFKICDWILHRPGVPKDRIESRLGYALLDCTKRLDFEMTEWLLKQPGMDINFHSSAYGPALPEMARNLRDNYTNAPTMNEVLSFAKLLIDNGADPYMFCYAESMLSYAGVHNGVKMNNSIDEIKKHIEKHSEITELQQFVLDVKKYYDEKHNTAETSTQKEGVKAKQPQKQPASLEKVL